MDIKVDSDGSLKRNILVVDDDPELRGLVRDFLSAQGYAVFEADGGNSMRHRLDRTPIDVVVLDVMMPGEDGLSIARKLSEAQDVGLIIVSALGSESDRIIGLEVGADDYLAKPVSPRELLARIRAVLRRRQHSSGEKVNTQYRFEGWTCDLLRRTLHDPDGVLISLSDGEFAVLKVLVEKPQRVLTRDQILECARGQDSEAFDRAIDTQISRLRRKLGVRADTELIRTVRNEGYMFVAKVTK
jgi:two-component system OmpR family response regulator